MTISYFKRAQATTVLTIAALLAFVGQSYGQQNSIVFPWQAQAYRQSAGVESPRWYFPPSSTQMLYPSRSVEYSRAFYPASVDPDKVLIDVSVPTDAKITVEGVKTTQIGRSRRFVSPSLSKGFQYSYDIKATWMEDGKEVSKNQSIAVRPGDMVQITFTRDIVTIRQEK